MTSSTVELPQSVQDEMPVRFQSLRSSLLRVKELTKRLKASQTSFAKLTKAEDCVRCIRHEVRFLEEYPPQAIGQLQQERLEHYCRCALLALESNTDQSARPLQEAIRNLIPSLACDFDRIRLAAT